MNKANSPTDLPRESWRPIEEDQTRATIIGNYADTGSRVFMVVVIAVLFGWLNFEVMHFIRIAFDADIALLKTTPTASRIVTTQVLVSMVGATVIQVGVAIVTVFAYLFPKAKPDGGK